VQRARKHHLTVCSGAFLLHALSGAPTREANHLSGFKRVVISRGRGKNWWPCPPQRHQRTMRIAVHTAALRKIVEVLETMLVPVVLVLVVVESPLSRAETANVAVVGTYM